MRYKQLPLNGINLLGGTKVLKIRIQNECKGPVAVTKDGCKMDYCKRQAPFPEG